MKQYYCIVTSLETLFRLFFENKRQMKTTSKPPNIREVNISSHLIIFWNFQVGFKFKQLLLYTKTIVWHLEAILAFEDKTTTDC